MKSNISFDFDQSKPLILTVPYFHKLDDQSLRDVAQEIIERHYTAGQIIFLEGEPGAGLHLVASGLCKVYRLFGQPLNCIIERPMTINWVYASRACIIIPCRKASSEILTARRLAIAGSA